MGKIKPMQRTLISQTTEKVDTKVTVNGWVYVVRDHGKLSFADIFDRSGEVQVVLKTGQTLSPFDVVSVTGTVKKRPVDMVNSKLKTGEIEIDAEKVEILSHAKQLPFDMGAEDLNLSIPTLLDNRALTLRHPRQRAIFKIEAALSGAFADFLTERGFVRIHTPKIVASATEGGANLFEVKYFDRKAYLAQSPQFYKQIGAGAFERVFEIGPVFRAEEHDTARHLNEYTSLDLEMAFVGSIDDLMALERDFLDFAFEKVRAKNAEEVGLLAIDIPEVGAKIPQVKLSEAQKILESEYSRKAAGEVDLDPEDEKRLSEYFLKKEKSEFVFVTHYPAEKRPFYAMPDPKAPGLTLSFDLLFRGLEVTTGGLRINDYEMLASAIKGRGLESKDFSYYLQAFQYSMPPEGGLAIGLERLTARLLKIDNVRQTSLFPRDISRLVP